MKSEKLYDSITNIRDDLIENATVPQKGRRKKWWRGAIAAGLAVVVVAGVLLWPEKNPVVPTACAIWEAEYPEMAPYPNDDDYWLANGDFDFDGYSQAYEAWNEDVQAQHREDGYADGLQQFFVRTVPEFLVDSPEENPIYSPLNVYMALSMLAEVTDGTSRQQILQLLGSADLESLRSQAADVWNAAYRKDGAVSCVLANSLWLDEDIDFVPSTLETLAKNYYASSYRGTMGSAEFDDTLHDWLNAQTGGLLKEQAQEIQFDPQTILALASTVYFQSKWSSEFSPSKTAPGVFHGPSEDQTVEFMNKEEGGTYYWDDHFGAIAQGLESGGKMWLFLPKEGETPQQLLSRNSMMELVQNPQQWENQKECSIRASIPKFDVTSQMDLRYGLEKLGITHVFDPDSSDFSPITDANPTFLSYVKHDARVTIDEEGVTAAAYTVMGREAAELPPEEKIDFVADRPFVFVITSNDNLPLFIGVVNSPNALA